MSETLPRQEGRQTKDLWSHKSSFVPSEFTLSLQQAKSIYLPMKMERIYFVTVEVRSVI